MRARQETNSNPGFSNLKELTSTQTPRISVCLPRIPAAPSASDCSSSSCCYSRICCSRRRSCCSCCWLAFCPASFQRAREMQEDMANPRSTSQPTRVVRVLLGVTGSVAAIKAGHLIQELRKAAAARGLAAEIELVVTDKGLFFLPESLRPFARREEAEWRRWSNRGDPVMHIELRRWADVFVIAPLSANSLAKLSAGLCDTLLTCVARAWDYSSKPLLAAPAMNTFMWRHPVTSRHLKLFEQFGAIVRSHRSSSSKAVAVAAADAAAAAVPPAVAVTVACDVCMQIVSPIQKRLVCGDTGLGAMADPPAIAAAAFEAFAASRVGRLPAAPSSYAVDPVNQQQLAAAAAAAVSAAAAAAAAAAAGVGSSERENAAAAAAAAQQAAGELEMPIPGGVEAWSHWARQLLAKKQWASRQMIPACAGLAVLLLGDDPNLTERLRDRLNAEGTSRLLEAFEELLQQRVTR
ncbi:hypothetical protein Efla_002485 [Eimeria flavescens]